MGDRNDSKKPKKEISVAIFFVNAALWAPKHGNFALRKLRIPVGGCFLCRPTETRLNSVGGSRQVYFAPEMINAFPSMIKWSGL